MGVSCLGNTCWTYPNKGKKTPPPNPDPSNFLVLDRESFGRYLLVAVKYPDCTNYEGLKILIYKDVDVSEIRKAKSLDPHFQLDRMSPLMRIAPTPEGWNLGRAICAGLQRENELEDNKKETAL